MGIADVIVIVVVLVIFALALRKVIIDKKRGKSCSCCSGDCSKCSRK